MIFDYITEFAGYLNDRGYAVTQNKISRFLSLKNEETDFTREAEIIPLMKLCFYLFLVFFPNPLFFSCIGSFVIFYILVKIVGKRICFFLVPTETQFH